MIRSYGRAFLFGLTATLGLALLLSGPLTAGPSAADQKVNINTATSAELQTLPRIGSQIAQRIIDFREKNGPFQKIEELMKVQGIGEKVYQGLREQITVGKPAKK